jgi:hypothetical protein
MFKMFGQPAYNTATRKKFFGLSEETKLLSEEPSELFKNIDGILKQCGGGLAPEVSVTEMEAGGGEFICSSMPAATFRTMTVNDKT